MIGDKTKKRKLVFVESNESLPSIEEKLSDKKSEVFDLWVRAPDSEKLDKMQLAARLCSCKEVCLAVIEDEF
jgi:hypothetical protein